MTRCALVALAAGAVAWWIATQRRRYPLAPCAPLRAVARHYDAQPYD